MNVRSLAVILAAVSSAGCIKDYPVSPIPADVSRTTLLFASQHSNLGMQTFSSLAADIYDYGASPPESRGSVFSDAYRGTVTMASGETRVPIEVPVSHHIGIVFRLIQNAQVNYQFTCTVAFWFVPESAKTYRVRYTLSRRRGCSARLVDENDAEVPRFDL